MKRIARKVKIGHTDLLLIWGLALNYVFTVLHLFFFIYIYKPKQKNNEKEENSSDGLAEAGWNLEI